MRRREFITHLSGAAAVWPIAARAQQPSRIWHVGYLSPAPLNDFARALFGAFRLKLQELDYVEGRNLILDVRRADGDFARLAGLAAELVSLRPDVIFALGTRATAAMKRATSSKPIVALAANLVELGLAQSLARPGGNITGIDAGGSQLFLKLLEILKQVVPGLSRMATLGVPGNPSWDLTIAGTADVARRLGFSIENFLIDARAIEAIAGSFDEMAQKGIEGVVISSDLIPDPRIAHLALRHRIAAAFYYTAGAEAGGLFAYETEFKTFFQRAAGYVDKILKGAAPADLPIEFATHFKFTLNLRTANALGITVPDAILAYADRVIE